MLFPVESRMPDGRLRIYFVTDPPAIPGLAPSQAGQASLAQLPPAGAASQPGRERRCDPLHPDAVFLTTGRQARPVTDRVDGCPLCPSQSGLDDGVHEAPWPGYRVAVFGNRFPALGPGPLPDRGEASPAGTVRVPAGGSAEMVLYTPDHEGNLGHLEPEQAGDVVRVWGQRTAALFERPDTAYVYVFENRGNEVGATLSHPHGQIYALPFVPRRMEALARVERSEGTGDSGRDDLGRGACRVCYYLTTELDTGVRVVDRERASAGAGFVALCPYAPRFPYEIQVLPERCVDRLDRLSDGEAGALGSLLGRTVRRLDAIFGTPMPYMMFVVQGGRDLAGSASWRAAPTPRHLRVVFAPLRRHARRLKVLASSEVGADVYLTDVLPEEAAIILRAAGVDAR